MTKRQTMPRKSRVERERNRVGPKATGGRPRVPIDWGKVANLCAAGAFAPSIAHEFGITAQTLYDRVQEEKGMDFTTFRRSHLERGDDLLRVKQFDMAVNGGNERLLIFLGKNRLGQRDKVEMSGPGGTALPVVNIQVLPPSNGASEG